jgi:hypothetical protein
MLAISDTDIRKALHGTRLKAYRAAPDTIVVDELGLAHAKARIDIAVINGCVHGYEIKSSLDKLDRLPSQLDLYRLCLSKLTLVVVPKHVNGTQKIVPIWCGILEARKGLRGSVTFTAVRRGRVNPDVDAVHLAHLLWRAEAVALLARFDASPKELRQSRKLLYARLAELMTVQQLTTAIREFMERRSAWRDPPGRA